MVDSASSVDAGCVDRGAGRRPQAQGMLGRLFKPADGDPAPRDACPAPREFGIDHLGLYVHVPFCATRCGYCDFNTYIGSDAGARSAYAAAAVAEVRMAARTLGARARPVDTVFFGGGTPTLMDAGDLAAILGAIDESFGLADGAEVTTEANPEDVSAETLAALHEAGFTRVSLGMQSAVAHVLAALDRRHTPGRPAAAVAEARAAGFEHVSLDLIYGTPGESETDWSASLAAALAADPDHISAYALSVEPGTALHARVRRGEVAAPDPDEAADRYLAAEEVLAAAGRRGYDISNGGPSDEARCRHNLGYW